MDQRHLGKVIFLIYLFAVMLTAVFLPQQRSYTWSGGPIAQWFAMRDRWDIFWGVVFAGIPAAFAAFLILDREQ